jgi:hypothetical protein
LAITQPNPVRASADSGLNATADFINGNASLLLPCASRLLPNPYCPAA